MSNFWGPPQNAFHEQIAKLNIGEGDIVVICHTSYDDDDTILDTELAWITYDWHKELLPIFREKDFLNMLKSYPEHLKDTFYRWITRTGNQYGAGSYARNAFNEYGDVVYKPESGKVNGEDLFVDFATPEVNNTCANRLNMLNDYCNSRGAHLVVAGYPIGFGENSTYTREDFKQFQEQLANALTCDVISDFTDYFFPYDLFYDTQYHLTEEGAELRTEILISDLQRWKAKENQ